MLLNLRNMNRPGVTTQMEMSTNINFKGKMPAHATSSTGMTGTTYSSAEIERHVKDNDEVGNIPQGSNIFAI
jgi:hypothetical protein